MMRIHQALLPMLAVLVSFAGPSAEAQPVSTWSRTYNTPMDHFAQPGCGEQPFSAKSQIRDGSGNLYVTGCAGNGANNDILTVKYDGSSGAVLWSKVYSGTAGGDDRGYAITLDGAGNVIITGRSADLVGGLNIRTIKYNGATGQEIWNVFYNGPGNGDDRGYALAVDGSNDIVVTGWSTGSGTGTDYRTIKYSGTNGTEVWNVGFNGTGNAGDWAHAVALDAAGNAIVTGFTTDSTGGENYRTIKYAAATGVELWNVTYNGNASLADRALALVVDGNNDAIVTGYSNDTGQATNIRTIKYSGANGSEAWNVAYSGALNLSDIGWAIALDASGNPVVAGISSDNSGGIDARVIKYSAAAGAVIWSTGYNGPGNGLDAAYALALDSSGNVLVTGETATATENNNILTMKLDGSTGANLWTATFNGSANGADRGQAVSADASGNVLLSGYSAEGLTSTDFRILKLNGSTGAQLWAAKEPPINGWAAVVGAPITARAMVMTPAGDVIVAGHTFGTTDWASFRVVKYSSGSGAELWNYKFEGNVVLGFDQGNALALDAAGDVFVTGVSSETGTNNNIRTVKLNGTNGSQVWTAVFSGSANATDVGLNIAVDQSGNPVVIGRANETGQGDNIRTIKYSGTTGAELWNAVYNGSANGNDQPRGVAIDAAGNVFVAGYSVETGENENVRVIKYDGVSGNQLWTSSYNGSASGSDRAQAMTLDGAGDVIVTGRSNETGQDNNIRTIKFNGATGAQVWASSFNGSANLSDTALGIVADAAGDIIVTGFSSETGQFDNIRTIKYSGTSGAEIWNVAYNGAGNGFDQGYAIALVPDGSVIVTGTSFDATATNNARTIRYAGSNGAVIWDFVTSGTNGADDYNYAVSVQGPNIALFGVQQDQGSAQSWFIQKLLDTTPVLAVAKNGTGTGTVTTAQPGINCGLDCSEAYPNGTNVTLTATPGPGSAFASWSGVTCAGGNTGLTCSFVFTANLTVTATFNQASAGPAKENDFNGDGKSDLLWRNSGDGSVQGWIMNGLSATQVAGLLPAGGYTITHVADLDGNGKMDTLIKHTDGTTIGWLHDGLNIVGQTTFFAAGSGWAIKQTADLNGDGKADLIVQHSTGTVVGWLMNGLTVTAVATFVPAGSGWSVAKVGDLNGDGKADLIWQNIDGTVQAWIMDGLNATQIATFVGAGAGWGVKLVGDMNGDGKADLVWQHTDGTVQAWLMNGTAVTQIASFVPAGTGWSPVLLGDISGDGKADLFWQHTDGRSQTWLMDGLSVSQIAGFVGAGGWSATHLLDLNGDGRKDVLWKHTDGTVQAWLMNGLTITQIASLSGPGSYLVVPPRPDMGL